MSRLAGDACVLEADDYAPYEEGGGTNCSVNGEISGDGTAMEAEKRIRREIANSNERRRMQSINAGFQSLRTLLPRHEGEKLSKAAILQQTAEYIYSLEQEKTRLLSQNCQLKRLLNQHEGGEIPLKKRKSEVSIPTIPAIIPDSTEETGSPTGVTILADEETRLQLERERRLRLLLEEQVRRLEAQLFPESARDLSHHMTLHYAAEEAPEEELKPEPRTVVLEAAPVPTPAPPPLCLPPDEPAPLLEAAIKAEPRVEVEVLPDATHDASSRLYLASTSRHNLETIVEAIRHLEGDHLFQEEAGDLPLALTTKPEQPRLLHGDPFLTPPPSHLHLHRPPPPTPPPGHQARPGVIVNPRSNRREPAADPPPVCARAVCEHNEPHGSRDKNGPARCRPAAARWVRYA